MKHFDSIKDALDYVVGDVIPAGHSYCVSILGTEEKSRKRASTIQVLSHDNVFEEDEGELRGKSVSAGMPPFWRHPEADDENIRPSSSCADRDGVFSEQFGFS